jgi:hypothetical protein
VKKLFAFAVIVLISVSFLPVRNSTKSSFANPLFENLWAEQSAAAGSLDLWGSEPLLWRAEPYADAPDGRRTVQYFDRGRMELTPTPNGGTEVTEGLLALEMTTGEIQLGSKLLEYKDPPDIAIDSGGADAAVPTYAGLARVVQRTGPDGSAQHTEVNQWIDAQGNVSEKTPPAAVWASQYVAQTGHNVPDVFTNLFANQAFGTMDWVQALGYPISEPYWTMYRRDGAAQPSLIQVFQRRILVYTPGLNANQRITLANVGRHYYRWRYGESAPASAPTAMAGDSSPMLEVSVPNGYQVGVYAQRVGTPVGLAIGPSGDLWIVTAQGNIVEVRSTTSGGAAGKTGHFAEGLPNPRGIAVDSNVVYVAVDDGIIRLRDTNNDGVADQRDYISKAVEPAPGPQGAPVLGPDGKIYVAGRLLPDGRDRVVTVTSPSGGTSVASAMLAKPGPLLLKNNDLYAVDQRYDGSSALYRLPILAGGALGSPSAPLAEFSSGHTINKVLLLADGFGPVGPDGSTLAAVFDGDHGKLVSLTPKSDGTLPDVVDFSTGFGQPDDMVVGLDGSLYVADATGQQVVKIVTNMQTRP